MSRQPRSRQPDPVQTARAIARSQQARPGPRSESRSVWRCERCNAFHLGGIDTEAFQTPDGTEGIRAVCGAEWREDRPSPDMWETPITAEDPAAWIWAEDADNTG